MHQLRFHLFTAISQHYYRALLFTVVSRSRCIAMMLLSSSSASTDPAPIPRMISQVDAAASRITNTSESVKKQVLKYEKIEDTNLEMVTPDVIVNDQGIDVFGSPNLGLPVMRTLPVQNKVNPTHPQKDVF